MTNTRRVHGNDFIETEKGKQPSSSYHAEPQIRKSTRKLKSVSEYLAKSFCPLQERGGLRIIRK